MTRLSQEERKDLLQAFSIQKSEKDTGGAAPQIALFTHRIKHLTHHLGTHKKDKSSRLGLIKLVGKRKRLLSYLKQKDLEQYRSVVTALNLRK